MEPAAVCIYVPVEEEEKDYVPHQHCQVCSRTFVVKEVRESASLVMNGFETFPAIQ
jgi:hypothetical protein